MATLTPRQQEVLDFIRNHQETLGVPPTRAEIARAFGFASANAAEDHVKALAKKGLLWLEHGSARGIRLVEQLGLPLVGGVAAGSPLLAVENVSAHYQVDPAMFSPRADFLLTVRGLSMTGIGIMDGDLLAVHRTAEARDGQVVVARLHDEVTVKRLQRTADGVELRPENPDFQTIVVDSPAADLVIEGVAVGLIRAGRAGGW